jgi:hypothetical protein
MRGAACQSNGFGATVRPGAHGYTHRVAVLFDELVGEHLFTGLQRNFEAVRADGHPE